jgi:hypothetical protein
MKRNKIFLKIFLITVLILVVYSPIFGSAKLIIDPQGDHVANSCSVSSGYIRDGDYTSTHYNDGEYLKFEPYWSLAFLCYQYNGYINFYFESYKYDQIKLDFIDTFYTGTDTVNIKVIYTTGDPDYFDGNDNWPNGYLEDGYYVFDLDSSRTVSYVRLHIQSLSWESPPRYIKIDMICLTIL